MTVLTPIFYADIQLKKNSHNRNQITTSGIKTDKISTTRMWANAQRDGRPAEYRWHPLFNAAKFG